MTDTPNRPPLWQLLAPILDKCVLQSLRNNYAPPAERDPHDAKRIADYVNIMINLANYLVPEEDKPNDELCCPPIYSMLWNQRMQFRALLTTEAERAERGELFWEQMKLRAWVSAQAERAKMKFLRHGSNPPPLSGAQAVLEAVCANTEPDCDTRHLIAAALRAAADQPHEVPPWVIGDSYWPYRNGIEAEQERNRKIATELENHQ